MSWHHSFGRVCDITFSNLCCYDILIIDRKCNLFVPTARIDELLTVAGDAVVWGNLEANGPLVTVLNDQLICGALEVKGMFTGNMVALDELDLNCGNIGNVELLEVNTIVSKGIDVGFNTLENVVVFKSPPVFGVPTSGGGARNQFWGYQSGYSATPAVNDSVAFGYNALRSLTSGDENMAIGVNVLSAMTSGFYNVCVGTNVLSAAQPDGVTAFGRNILVNSTADIQYSILIGTNIDPLNQLQYIDDSTIIVGHGDGQMYGAAAGFYNTIMMGSYNGYRGTTFYGAVAIGARNMQLTGIKNRRGKFGNSIAIGYDNQRMPGAGDYAYYNSQTCITIGERNGSYVAYARFNIAIGFQNVQPTGSGSSKRAYIAYNNIAVGFNCLSDIETADSLSYCIAMGFEAECRRDYSIALGYSPYCRGFDGIALGRNAQCGLRKPLSQFVDNGVNAVAIGHNAKAFEDNAIAIGYGAISSMNDAITLGTDAAASGVNAIAIGKDAVASVGYQIAIQNSLVGSGQYLAANATCWGQVFQDRTWDDGNTTIAFIGPTGDILKGSLPIGRLDVDAIYDSGGVNGNGFIQLTVMAAGGGSPVERTISFD